MTNKPNIFISHSHQDSRFVAELEMRLSPLRRRFDFELWSDQRIAVGERWESAIEAALDKVNIALLLVSPDYLASEWIESRELPKLLKRSEEGEARVIPIILRPCLWAHTQLAYIQGFPRGGKTYSELSELDSDRAWVELTEVLEAELHRLKSDEELSSDVGIEAEARLNEPDEPKTVSKPKRTDKAAGATSHKKGASQARFTNSASKVDHELPQFFISHAKEDGDFAENLKGRLREVALDAWIDVDVLEAGVDWRKEIDDAILQSLALILVLSPDSKSSEYVTYEWAFALGSGLRIVPLMLRDTSIHPRLEVFQYLDFTNRRARPWSRLFSLLQDIVKDDA